MVAYGMQWNMHYTNCCVQCGLLTINLDKMNSDVKTDKCDKYCDDNSGCDRLCKECDDKYENKTGYCSLDCCLGYGCDESCQHYTQLSDNPVKYRLIHQNNEDKSMPVQTRQSTLEWLCRHNYECILRRIYSRPPHNTNHTTLTIKNLIINFV